MIPTLLDHYQLVYPIPFQWQQHFTFHKILCGDPDPAKEEGFYSRFVYAPQAKEYCLQVVLYYRRQLFPYHVNDFHPFYAYFDSDFQMIGLLYDSGHHNAKSLQPRKRVILTVTYPWHGYAARKSLITVRFNAEDFQLTDSILNAWWLQDGKPQFKIRSKFVDPWHPGLRGETGCPGNFRDEAICPVCGDINLLDRMDLRGTLLWLDLRCRNNHAYRVTYDAQRSSLSSERSENISH